MEEHNRILAAIKDDDDQRLKYWIIYDAYEIEFLDELLSYSVDNDSLKCMIILLKFGANIDNQVQNGKTPLMIACKRGWIDCVEHLIFYGANINIENELDNWKCALMYACENSNGDIINLLLNSGRCIVDKTDGRGNTALFYAENEEIVNILVVNGINPSIANNDGLTALDVAINEGNRSVSRALERIGY